METDNEMSLMVHESFTISDVVHSLGQAINTENDSNCQVQFTGTAMAEYKDLRHDTAMISLRVGIGSHDSPTLIKKRACENFEKKRRGQLNNIRACTEKLVDISREVNDLIKTVNRISRKCCNRRRCDCETMVDQLNYTTTQTQRVRASAGRARSGSRRRSPSRNRSASRSSRARSSYSSASGRRRSPTGSRTSSRPIQINRGMRAASVSARRPSHGAPARPAGACLPGACTPARQVLEVEEDERATGPIMADSTAMTSTLNALTAGPPTPAELEPEDFVTNMDLGTPANSAGWDTAELESIHDYDLEAFVSSEDRDIVDIESIETLSVDAAEVRPTDHSSQDDLPADPPVTSTKAATPPPAENNNVQRWNNEAGFWPGSEGSGETAIQTAREKICLQARDLDLSNPVLSLEMLFARHTFSNVLLRGEREFGKEWFVTSPDLNHSHLILEARQLDRSGLYKSVLKETMAKFRDQFNNMGWAMVSDNRVISRETVIRARVAEVIIMRQLEALKLGESKQELKWDKFISRFRLMEIVKCALRVVSIDSLYLEREAYCMHRLPQGVLGHVQRLRGEELFYNIEHYCATRCGDRLLKSLAPHLRPATGHFLMQEEFRIGLQEGASTSEDGGISILMPDLIRPQGGLYM